MALFGNDRESQRMAAMLAAPKPVEPVTIMIEYYDGTNEQINIVYNLEEIQRLFSQAMGNSSGLNFTNFDPPITINPKWIKKVTFLKGEQNGYRG